MSLSFAECMKLGRERQQVETFHVVGCDARAGLITEYNQNIERLLKADRLIAETAPTQVTLDRWLDECAHMYDAGNSILSRIGNDVYRDGDGYLYADVPTGRDKAGFSFIRGELESLLDESIADDRFLKQYYIFKINSKHCGGAGADRIVIVLPGCLQAFKGDVVLTRSEYMHLMSSASINENIEAIRLKKFFGNGVDLMPVYQGAF